MFAAGFNTPGFKTQPLAVTVYASRECAVCVVCALLDEHCANAVESAAFRASGADDFRVQGLEVFIRSI